MQEWTHFALTVAVAFAGLVALWRMRERGIWKTIDSLQVQVNRLEGDVRALRSNRHKLIGVASGLLLEKRVAQHEVNDYALKLGLPLVYDMSHAALNEESKRIQSIIEMVEE